MSDSPERGDQMLALQLLALPARVASGTKMRNKRFE